MGFGQTAAELRGRLILTSTSAGLFLWCALYACIGAVGTRLARRYALQRRLLDEPGERRSHHVATPRGGGIAIALALMIAIAAMIARQPSQIVLLGFAGIGLLLVAGIGWIDDHRPLSPWLRLFVHAVAALSLSTGVLASGSSPIMAATSFCLTMVLVNIWNFMDGIDGIAATQAVIVTGGFTLFTGGPVASFLGLALISAICGFLPFNLPRAKIFLGDVGSGALGYAMALMAVFAMNGMPQGFWPLLLLPLSAFLIDAGLTLSSRIVRGQRWWLPHVDHTYQHWAHRAGSHLRVTIGYAFWTLLACIMTWNFRGEGPRTVAVIVPSWFCGGAVVWYWLRNKTEPQSLGQVDDPVLENNRFDTVRFDKEGNP